MNNHIRLIKVMGGLMFLAIKFYLLAWFYIPRSFLLDAKAPKTLDELEYEAKHNPAFLFVIAFYAIFFICAVSFVFYAFPALMLAKYF